MAAAGGSAPGRQPATAHVRPRLTHDNLLLHMQHELGQGNQVAVANVLRNLEPGIGTEAVGILMNQSAMLLIVSKSRLLICPSIN